MLSALPTGPESRGLRVGELPPEIVSVAVDKVGKSRYRAGTVRLGQGCTFFVQELRAGRVVG